MIPNSFGKDNFSLQDVLDGGTDVWGLEWSMTCDQFVYGNSCRPYINSFIVPSSHEHLWSPVVESTCDSEHVSSLISDYYLLTEAKIN